MSVLVEDVVILMEGFEVVHLLETTTIAYEGIRVHFFAIPRHRSYAIEEDDFGIELEVCLPLPSFDSRNHALRFLHDFAHGPSDFFGLSLPVVRSRTGVLFLVLVPIVSPNP